MKTTRMVTKSGLKQLVSLSALLMLFALPLAAQAFDADLKIASVSVSPDTTPDEGQTIIIAIAECERAVLAALNYRISKKYF